MIDGVIKIKDDLQPMEDKFDMMEDDLVMMEDDQNLWFPLNQLGPSESINFKCSEMIGNYNGKMLDEVSGLEDDLQPLEDDLQTTEDDLQTNEDDLDITEDDQKNLFHFN